MHCLLSWSVIDSGGSSRHVRGRALAQRFWPPCCGVHHLADARYNTCELWAASWQSKLKKIICSASAADWRYERTYAFDM